MPSDSEEEQRLIHSEVLRLKSFTNKLGQPKVANWFAWNGMAKTQIREPNATKCIIASQCVQEPDLDDDGAFADDDDGHDQRRWKDFDVRARVARMVLFDEDPRSG